MNKVSKFQFAAIAICFLFVACNNSENTESTQKDSVTNNSTVTAPAATAPDNSMDATKVAPGLYTVAKDSMGIRVVNVDYKPGDSSAMHSHPDNVLYVISDGKGEFTEKDGTKQVRDLKAGMVAIMGPDEHSVKNVGKTTMKAILFEVNRPNSAAAAQDATMDAVKVAPTLYKVLADSLNIRVLMATYKPGASSALHMHPDNAIYVIEGSKAEFTMKDGTKQQMTMDKGMITIMPAGAHAVKNVGNTTTRVLIVEVNRPQK
jgi:quercetin dioxygenase-like cupin family protein